MGEGKGIMGRSGRPDQGLVKTDLIGKGQPQQGQGKRKMSHQNLAHSGTAWPKWVRSAAGSVTAFEVYSGNGTSTQSQSRKDTE